MTPQLAELHGKWKAWRITWAGQAAQHLSMFQRIQNLKKNDYKLSVQKSLDKLFPAADNHLTCLFHYISSFVSSIVLVFIILWGPREFGFILVLFLQDRRSPERVFSAARLFL